MVFSRWRAAQDFSFLTHLFTKAPVQPTERCGWGLALLWRWSWGVGFVSIETAGKLSLPRSQTHPWRCWGCGCVRTQPPTEAVCVYYRFLNGENLERKFDLTSVTLNASCRPRVLEGRGPGGLAGGGGPSLSPSHPLNAAVCPLAHGCPAPRLPRPRPHLAPPPGGVASCPQPLAPEGLGR